MRMSSFGLVVTAGLVAVSTSPNWSAQLEPMSGSGIRGSVRVEGAGPVPIQRDTVIRDSIPRDSVPPQPMPRTPEPRGDSRATITIEGARDGMSHAWHIHQGRCGTAPGPIVGQESMYAPIAVDERGKGSSTASLASGLLEEGQAYSVSVHGGPAKEDPVVSCGDLRPEQGVPDRRQR